MKKSVKEKPIKLVLKKVLKAVRQAYIESRLTAQNEGERKYFGRGDTVCAIGAALPKNCRRRFVFDTAINKSALTGLLYQRVLSVPSLKEFDRLQCLQARHDIWTAAESRADKKEEENNFMQYLWVLEDENL